MTNMNNNTESYVMYRVQFYLIKTTTAHIWTKNFYILIKENIYVYVYVYVCGWVQGTQTEREGSVQLTSFFCNKGK